MNVALVTGASSGIGAAVAIDFAEAGWSVMAAGRDEGRLEEVADVSENISTWAGELEESADCDELVADTVEEFGAIDCLVNSAGVLIRGDAADTDDEAWRDTMLINLDVPFYLSRAALPQLLKTRGNIVNLASFWGLRAGPRATAYCVSKGGLILLTRAMALDYAHQGVRVNAVCPGDVDTPMLADDAAKRGMLWEDYLAGASDRPLGRIGTAEEIARAVLFLASDDSSFVTGEALVVDGGGTAGS